MALVVASSSRGRTRSTSFTGNPTASLIAGLRDFEAILSDKQRLTFRGNYGKPGPNDVLAFVSRVDAENKTRGRNCVAPRLCTFLDRLVQFTGIVDTFAQAAPVALLVWGSAKTAILAASNYASYFEKVTSMLMVVSRTCPVYQKFGDLYPGSVELQTALCDYYAIIVRLCIRIIEVSQRSMFSQVLGPVLNPFETDFTKITSDITQAAKDVDVQISFASQQAASEESQFAEAERKENSIHRRLMSKWKADNDELQVSRKLRQTAKLRLAVYNNICAVDHLKAWRQAKLQHLPGTAEWFSKDNLFNDWIASSDTSILWCYGKLGSGKSVFVSNIIARVLDQRQKDTDVVSYFLCRADDSRTTTSRTIFGSICRQVLSPMIETLHFDDLQSLLHRTADLDTTDVVGLMLGGLDAGATCYIILDGLDECGSKEINSIATALADICRLRPKRTRILCAGRPDLEASLFRYVQPRYRLHLTGDLVDKDIEQFITVTLDRNLENGVLVLGDPNLILDIVTALTSGANGMFLWARLLIEELCQYNSDNDIRAALADLPHELSQIYDRKLTRINGQPGGTVAIKALDFCCITKRPLTLDEMREALSVEIEQTSLAREKMVNDMYHIVSRCHGFLHVDEQDSTVHCIHQSVRQFLTPPVYHPRSAVHEINWETKFGLLCLTYLNFSDFDRRLVKREPDAFKIDPIAASHAISKSDKQRTVKLARKLLEMRGGNLSSHNEIKTRTLRSLLNSNSQGIDEEYSFLAYAREYWIFHLQDLHPSHGADSWDLFVRFVEIQAQASRLSNHFFEISNECTSIHDFAFEHDHGALMRYSHLVKHSELEGRPFGRMLIRSSSRGKLRLREVMMEKLMGGDAWATYSMGHHDFTAFLLGISEDSPFTLPKQSVETSFLYRQVLDDSLESVHVDWAASITNLSNSERRSLFRDSIESGHAHIVRHLIGIDRDLAYTEFSDGMSPIQVAALHAQPCVLEAFPRSSYFCRIKVETLSPLAAAAWNGDTKSADILIRSGPGAEWTYEQSDDGMYSPLGAAARNGSLTMVDYLLKHGADPNEHRLGSEPDELPYLSALELACSSGEMAVVEKLLIAGVSIRHILGSNMYSRPVTEEIDILFGAIRRKDLKMFESKVASGIMNYTGQCSQYLTSDERSANLKIIGLIVEATGSSSIDRLYMMTTLVQYAQGWMKAANSEKDTMLSHILPGPVDRRIAVDSQLPKYEPEK